MDKEDYDAHVEMIENDEKEWYEYQCERYKKYMAELEAEKQKTAEKKSS